MKGESTESRGLRVFCTIQETAMDKAKIAKSSSSDIPPRKETLRHLKVRTDLKGGVAAAFGFICGRGDPTGAPTRAADVVNPTAR
jgi:hypothetical protein